MARKKLSPDSPIPSPHPSKQNHHPLRCAWQGEKKHLLHIWGNCASYIYSHFLRDPFSSLSTLFTWKFSIYPSRVSSSIITSRQGWPHDFMGPGQNAKVGGKFKIDCHPNPGDHILYTGTHLVPEFRIRERSPPSCLPNMPVALPAQGGDDCHLALPWFTAGHKYLNTPRSCSLFSAWDGG